MLIGVLNDVSEATACGRSTPAGGPGEAVPPEGGGGTGRDGAASAARPPAEGARAPPSRRRETSAPRKSLPLTKGESCGPSWRCHGHVEVRESICRGGTVSQTCLWAFAVFTLEGNLLKAFKLGRWNKWWCLLSQIANMQQHNCYSHSPHLPRLSPCCREPLTQGKVPTGGLHYIHRKAAAAFGWSLGRIIPTSPKEKEKKALWIFMCFLVVWFSLFCF